ncbi:RING finger protein 148 isoform X2 [Labeo rohita]|uniref:RING finger protein 148 isoform X2 n=1 Tax=Labeo rohita TaxID=84645 RepID=UPI0021E2332B|nr:RING finger protein 148 isoform X2 [Labeo rohita]
MKANLKLTAIHGHGRSCIWLSVLVFQYCFQLSASLVFWTAYVDVEYFDRVSNETVNSKCECGIFGVDSPLQLVSGQVVLPNRDPLACSTDTTFTAEDQPWIALIKKGNCSYSQKIQAAQREGASAVVIYNIDGTGNETLLMPHPEADDIVALMVGNILGTEMANRIKNGSDVSMMIVVANAHVLWYSTTWAFALSFTFIGITAITMLYLAFLFIRRIHRIRQLRALEMEIKRENEKAIAKLAVRTLRTGDPEVESEDVSCAVCTDSFKANEQVTVLPCRHLYHKKCIEPWLLEHPTCPMCKFHIIKYKIDEESDEPPSSSSSSSSSPPSGETFCLAVIRTEQLNTSNSQSTDTLGHQSDCYYSGSEIQTAHIYENLAFEEPEKMEHHNISSRD